MNQQDPHASFYGEMARLNFVPGWARTEPAPWASPRPKFKPAVSSYAQAKVALDTAGAFVPSEPAGRLPLEIRSSTGPGGLAQSQVGGEARRAIVPGGCCTSPAT